MKLIYVSSCGFAMAVLCSMLHPLAAKEEIEANPAAARSGIEGGSWSLEPWGNSGTVDFIRVHDVRSAKAIFSKGEKDKTSFKHLTRFGADPEGALRCAAYNPQDFPVHIAFAFSSGPLYVWHESRPIVLKKGWNNLEIKLQEPFWKSEKSDWKFTGPLAFLDDIRAVNLTIYHPPETSGWILLQGLTFDPNQTGKKTQAALEKLYHEDPEVRNAGEGALIEIGRLATEALLQAARSERTEVMLRALHALRKIEEAEEELPQDETLRNQVMLQREKVYFQEMNLRVQYALHALRREEQKIKTLLNDAREAEARGRKERQTLKLTTDEELKAFEAELNELKELTERLQKMFSGN